MSPALAACWQVLAEDATVAGMIPVFPTKVKFVVHFADLHFKRLFTADFKPSTTVGQMRAAVATTLKEFCRGCRPRFFYAGEELSVDQRVVKDGARAPLPFLFCAASAGAVRSRRSPCFVSPP